MIIINAMTTPTQIPIISARLDSEEIERPQGSLPITEFRCIVVYEMILSVVISAENLIGKSGLLS